MLDAIELPTVNLNRSRQSRGNLCGGLIRTHPSPQKLLVLTAFVFGVLILARPTLKTNRKIPNSPLRSSLGSDRDEHGCIASAGYQYCEVKNECIRLWETKCKADDVEPPMLGGDRDDHGCVGSAGYQWCDKLGKCIQPWETTCIKQK